MVLLQGVGTHGKHNAGNQMSQNTGKIEPKKPKREQHKYTIQYFGTQIMFRNTFVVLEQTGMCNMPIHDLSMFVGSSKRRPLFDGNQS